MVLVSIIVLTTFGLWKTTNKVGTEIKGYHFIINVEKSRYVKEKSKILFRFLGKVTQRFSGLLDVVH